MQGIIEDDLARALEMAYVLLSVYCETDRCSMAMMVFAPRGGAHGVGIRPPVLPAPPTRAAWGTP